MTSSARRSGSDYVLNGEKMWISLASRADHFLWFARTNPEASDPHDGLSAFVLEADRPGVTRGDIHGKLGIRAGSTGWVHCQDVRLPAECRIGEEGEGFRIAMSCLDGGRYTVAAGATGLIRACLEASLLYARQRQAFGREVAGFQLIQRKIAGTERSATILAAARHGVDPKIAREAMARASHKLPIKCRFVTRDLAVTAQAPADGAGESSE